MGLATVTPPAARTASVTAGPSPPPAPVTTMSAITPSRAWPAAAAETVDRLKICTEAIATASASGVTALASRREAARVLAAAKIGRAHV